MELPELRRAGLNEPPGHRRPRQPDCPGNRFGGGFTLFRYKSIIGDALRTRSPAGQGSEAVLGCEILNRMTALGRPVSYRIGR